MIFHHEDMDTVCLNYFADDEIRQNEGFKNVSLGNVIPATFMGRKLSFLSPDDEASLVKHAVSSFEVRCCVIVFFFFSFISPFSKPKTYPFNQP